MTAGGRSNPWSANALMTASSPMTDLLPRTGARCSPSFRRSGSRGYSSDGRFLVEAICKRVGLEPHRHVLRDQILELVGRERLGEEESLAQVALPRDELLQLVGALDALGGRLEVQGGCELDHGRGGGGGFAALRAALGERLAKLQGAARGSAAWGGVG